MREYDSVATEGDGRSRKPDVANVPIRHTWHRPCSRDRLAIMGYVIRPSIAGCRVAGECPGCRPPLAADAPGLLTTPRCQQIELAPPASIRPIAVVPQRAGFVCPSALEPDEIRRRPYRRLPSARLNPVNPPDLALLRATLAGEHTSMASATATAPPALTEAGAGRAILGVSTVVLRSHGNRRANRDQDRCAELARIAHGAQPQAVRANGASWVAFGVARL